MWGREIPACIHELILSARKLQFRHQSRGRMRQTQPSGLTAQRFQRSGYQGRDQCNAVERPPLEERTLPRSRPSRIFRSIKDALEMTGSRSCESKTAADLPRGDETPHVRAINAPWDCTTLTQQQLGLRCIGGIRPLTPKARIRPRRRLQACCDQPCVTTRSQPMTVVHE